MFCFKGMFLTLLPWWGSECFVIIASQMSEYALAATTLLRNVVICAQMLTIGYSFAIAHLVGKHLGAVRGPQVKKAKYYAKLGFWAILVWAAIIQIILEFGKDSIIFAFTNDPDVQGIISSIFYLVCTFILFEVL